MEAKEGDIGAFITRCPDRALAEAEAVDDARVRGEELPPLDGGKNPIESILNA